jgi:hypothetical protein
MKRCIFCRNPRTRKRGEHVWDAWLNRERGVRIKSKAIITEFGRDDLLVREYPAIGLNVTKDIVCDTCNNEWMSDIAAHAKRVLEGIIRHDEPRTLDTEAIVTVAALAFLKAAVLDWSGEETRTPCISRSLCTRFQRSLTSPSSDAVVLPDGLQIWIAGYRSKRKMEARAHIDELEGSSGSFRGCRILLITYIVGFFALQLTFPQWRKRSRQYQPLPSFQPLGDMRSVAIWPNVRTARWPPRQYLSRGTLDDFRERFRRVLVPTSFT